MGARILFIEDEAATHFALREYFGERGYAVDGARTREEALERLASAHYPVVIADLRLSANDGGREPEGLEIVEEVRRRHPDARLLVLTACGEEFEAEALRRGADCFLQKPQPLPYIAEIIESLRGGRPMPHDRDKHRDAPALPGEFAPTRKKVLLVDDSKTVLLMEQALLSRTYDVLSARDGREGVEKAFAERPDLILMDVVMPQMNGIEAVRRLRAAPETKDIPVIMVSTRGELESVERGYESGCNDYVTKPFSGVELLAKVKSFLG